MGLATTLDPRHLDLTTTPSPSVRAKPKYHGSGNQARPKCHGSGTTPDPSDFSLETTPNPSSHARPKHHGSGNQARPKCHGSETTPYLNDLGLGTTPDPSYLSPTSWVWQACETHVIWTWQKLQWTSFDFYLDFTLIVLIVY